MGGVNCFEQLVEEDGHFPLVTKYLKLHVLTANFAYVVYICLCVRLSHHSFIHSAISIAPLQVLYNSEALPTTARILYRSFTPKRTSSPLSSLSLSCFSLPPYPLLASSHPLYLSIYLS